MSGDQSIAWDGHVITKPGIYSRVPLETYHGNDICDGPSVSSSGLRTLFSKSPAHFYDTWSGNPAYVENEDKPHFVLGRAVHHLILGEPHFAKTFAAQPTEWENPDGEILAWRTGKGGVLHADAWTAEMERAGRAILKPDQVEAIRGMARALGSHPIIRAGALNGMIERSIFWKDKDTGIWLKSRPDSIPTGSQDFVDYKSTDSVQYDDLVRAIYKFGYCQQGALVCEGAKQVLKFDNPTFTLIFQEKIRPYCVRVVQLKPTDLDYGSKMNRLAINTIAKCLKSGAWPGPGGERPDAEYIELSQKQHEMIDDRLKYGI